MQKLVICCDGTWNDENNQNGGVLALTNVRQFAVLASSMQEQKVFYDKGVGTGNCIDKIVGGAFGKGIAKNIKEAYIWLAQHYQEGDKIYLLGFSRGAFTARSLNGFLSKCGLLDLRDVEDGFDRVKNLYNNVYKKQAKENIYKDKYKFYNNANPIPIEFIGVWDTVGALGIPDNKRFLNIFDNIKKYAYHNIDLTDNVISAYHALSIDEQRSNFTPTLWQDNPRVTQVWFCGVHSDIGGGYKEHGLADCTLMWMIQQAKKHNLNFNEDLLQQTKPNPYDYIHTSDSGAMALLGKLPRSIPNMENDINKDKFNQSVFDRKAYPPIQQGIYRQTHKDIKNIVAQIDSKKHWNWTGVYIEKGQTYTLQSTGKWGDDKIYCDASGVSAMNLLSLRADAVGIFYQSSKYAKRVNNTTSEKFPLFGLVGAIMDNNNVSVDGTPQGPFYFFIGEARTFVAETSGYLYCFANDILGFYENNTEFITLNINQI